MPFILSLLGPLLGKIIDTVGTKVGVDMNSDEIKAKKIDLELELQKLISQTDLKQLDINIAEAANPNRTWPTWREMLGYVCVLAVGYHFVIQQMLSFFLSLGGIATTLPALDMTGLLTILSAMLGVHFVDSRYNSPAGIMPTPATTKVNTDSTKGRLVNDPEAGGLVWRID